MNGWLSFIGILYQLHQKLGFDEDVLKNFAQFVDIIEVAMSHTPKSDEDLCALYILAKSFLEGLKDFMFR